MSGLKRMVTSRRRAAAEANAPAKPTEERKPGGLANRTTVRRDLPSAPPPPVPAPPQQTLDIAAVLATARITPPAATSASTESSATTPGTPLAARDPAPPPGFCLARQPAPSAVALVSLLAKSPRKVTVKKADAERYSLVTALHNARDLAVLTRVLERYVPYALTCWDVAGKLKAKGTNVATGVVWTSGLSDAQNAKVKYDGGLGLEVAMVLMLFGLSKVREIIETEAEFAMQPDQTLVTQIKTLQVAAGIFAYLRDTVAPTAIADFAGTPPPELFPETSAVFHSFSLCLAQALHVRRAALSGMSTAVMAKLSAGAADLAREAIAKYEVAIQAGIPLSPDVKAAAADILLLLQGWLFQYFGLTTTPEENAGGRVSALRAAHAHLQKASKSVMVGKVAALDLDMITKELDDAEGENRVVYQHRIPSPDELQLPPGRSLVHATPYDAPRIPKAENPSQ